MKNLENRRKHVRFTLDPMYTRVSVRTLDKAGREAEGHAYDISEGGMRFEVDRLMAPGTPVSVRVALPGAEEASGGVEAEGELVWLEDAEDPPPYRVAAVFKRFAREGDRERLLGRLSSGRLRLAA